MVTNVMITGVGGQGTLLTSRIIGQLAINKGYEVKVSEVHGMAQRGGSVVTFVRFGKNIAEPVVEEGGADVLISFEKMEALRYAHFVKKDGVIIANDCRIDPITVVTGVAKYPENPLETLSKTHKLFSVDANAKALELGNSKVFNTVILGLVATKLEFTKEEWLKVIETTVPQKTIEINKKAFLLGYEG